MAKAPDKADADGGFTTCQAARVLSLYLYLTQSDSYFRGHEVEAPEVKCLAQAHSQGLGDGIYTQDV